MEKNGGESKMTEVKVEELKEMIKRGDVRLCLRKSRYFIRR
jgi:hypothetical protein